MMKKISRNLVLSNQQLEKEFARTVLRNKRKKMIIRCISIILVFAAVAVLVSTIWLPVYRVTGNSMAPNLERGQIVVGMRFQRLKAGDVAALYYQNQILLRRVIGESGDWIHIDEQGAVSVNGMPLEETYLTNTVLGTTDLTYPYQVREECYFVMGDNRATSADSRMSDIGCIARDKIAGKIIFRIWPLAQVGYIG